MLIPLIQSVLPASVKNRLKPYYRTFFPNRLHILFSPTYRCNYTCSYCPVVTRFDYTSVVPGDQEKTPAEWISALAKLPPALIFITGGEPFVYKGLPDLINGLGKHGLLGVVTNATAPIKIYDRIAQSIQLHVSFHREFIEEPAFLAKVDQLRQRHKVQVNIVATPENLPLIEQIATDFSAQDVALHVDPYIDTTFTYSPAQRAMLDRVLQADRAVYLDRQLAYDDYGDKTCSAGQNYFALAPNGDVYTCVGGKHYLNSPLYQHILEAAPAPQDLEAYRMGNLFDAAFRLNDGPIRCVLPCGNPCDFDSVTIRQTR